MAEERQHSLLGASSAKRWINCPPSARLTELYPEKPSEYAAEGTLAHDLGELKLRKVFTALGMPDKEYKALHNKIKKDPLYKEEMEKYTDAYVEYVQGIAYGYPASPTISLEQKVDYGHVAPEGYGFVDCVVISGTEMHVIDFKYGKGVPVKAEGNPQLSLYAIGALGRYGMFYPVDKVTLHIVQPRIGGPSSWSTTARELTAWGEVVVKPNAELAYRGEGEFKQGPWCDSCFCKVAGICRARADANLPVLRGQVDPITGKMKPPATLSNEELGMILPLLVQAEPWIKKVKAAALDKILNGEEVPGWKLVEGCSDRKITDIDAAYKALIKAGYKKAMLYNHVPVTLTEVENLISKEDYDGVLAPYVVKPQGKPTLAPLDDKRPEYKREPTADMAFGGENSLDNSNKEEK